MGLGNLDSQLNLNWDKLQQVLDKRELEKTNDAKEKALLIVKAKENGFFEMEVLGNLTTLRLLEKANWEMSPELAENIFE